MEKIHVNFDDFSDYRNYFDTKKNEIDSILKEVYIKSREVEWKGMGHDALNDRFLEQLEKLENIPMVLNLLKEFMDYAINDYQEGMNDIIEKFKELKEIIQEEKQIMR